MKKHANLSIFVPHAGCHHRCSFCDQRTISQTQKLPSAADIAAMCEQYLPQNGDGVEIAFFGGSFTAIDESTQKELLAEAFKFVQNKRADGIRLSTRPDAINLHILTYLRSFGVSSIELGAQSMCDNVLQNNLRGHTSQQVCEAASMIKQEGFSLGLQMMPGLYAAENYEHEAMQTLTRLLQLTPDTMRIYPAIVLQNTALAAHYLSGEYKPLTIEEAVQICARLILKCEATSTRVIRVGLAADVELEKAVLSGPYHPAFRELCEANIYYRLISNELYKRPTGDYQIDVKNTALSAAKGHKKKNELLFLQNGYNVTFMQNDKLSNREFILQLRK